MKRKLVIILLGVLVLLNVTYLGIKTFKSDDIEEGFNDLSQIKYENTLSMMLEQNAGAGDYELETRSTWPTQDDGYIFNSTLSKCENGSTLSWDEENNVILMVGNTSDKCYVYFDKVPLTLANWVIEQYTSQTSGSETIYLHDASLANGAGDNSYRYAGANPNNYVCFGSDATTCPDDNLYRIIGVFGNQVKLIKWDYATTTLLGTDGDYSNTYSGEGRSGTNKGTNLTTAIGAYYWNYANSSATYNATNYYNVWSYSKLNTVNLNTNFLNNIGSTWASKIATTTWKVGGTTGNNVYNSPAATAYTNEYTSPAENTTYNAKIGLMYTSDYGFAAAPSAWTTNLSSYNNSSITAANWMYMGLIEWTVVRVSGYPDRAFYVFDGGYVFNVIVNLYAFGVRPVFHLESSVNYGSGLGSKANPVRLS